MMVFLIQRAQNKDSLMLHLKPNKLLTPFHGVFTASSTPKIFRKNKPIFCTIPTAR